jgi:multidrug efflux pump subunit AcrA (membrane-fusion protein)
MVGGTVTSASKAETLRTVETPGLPVDAPASIARGRRFRVRPLALLGSLLLAAAAVYGSGVLAPGPPAPVAPAAPVRAPFDARGQVSARATARVASLIGGVVREVIVRPGARVREGDALARVKTPDGGVEALSAPFGGTVLTVPVQIGDSVLAGMPVVVVGDLSQLQVESTDVDEYLIGSLRVGQAVQVEADAVPGRVYSGRITSLALATEPGAGGRPHYPAKIALDDADGSLRPNMNVRLRFIGLPGR